jgi:hypothetical protein
MTTNGAGVPANSYVQGRKRVCFVNLVIPAPGDWYTEGPGEGSRRAAQILAERDMLSPRAILRNSSTFRERLSGESTNGMKFSASKEERWDFGFPDDR